MIKKYRNFLIFLSVMVFSIGLELALDSLGVKEENIYLVFVLAILIINIETKNIWYGLAGSLIMVLSFNYFITEPRRSFDVSDTNYYVSFIMFIVVTFMVNSLVLQLQRQIRKSKENEKKVNYLYRFSNDFLHAQSRNDVYQKAVVSLDEYLINDVSIVSDDGTIYGKAISDTLDTAIEFASKSNTTINKANPMFRNIEETILPINSQLRSYGAIVIDGSHELSEEDMEFVRNVIEEMTVVLEKNYIAREQERTRVQVENEKFKTSLLRGLSHDIKTPLTMIQGGSNFLYESFEQLEEEEKKGIIRDIYDESCDLSEFVNNLLDMTRLDEENVKLNKINEAVDDILFEVNEKVKKRLGNKKLIIHNSDEMVLVYADVSLLTQVFVNLIDNAIKHTRDNTVIDVDYQKKENEILFRVKDNGGGIKPEKIEHIFENFYSITANQDRKRNHGLGLGICKTIIEAHEGKIWAYNNDEGGVTFEFTLPLTGE
ncbi:MAG: DUF4118 domain-containing protein [Erysipelotrichaceae bacterium]|nr:DUF4118 domain-containing protein [Erysipelotrichaceae bacterium]